MTTKLIPDNGDGVTVNAPAKIKRVGCETHCPQCGVISYLGQHGGGYEKRFCYHCQLSWERGTWCYLVQFIEPEAKS